MFGSIMLVIVTLFAVIGAYYLSDLMTNYLFRTKLPRRMAIVLAADSMETMWNSVLNVRAKLPHSEIIVLCAEELQNAQVLAPSLQDVTFATPDTVGELVQRQLML